MSSRKIFLSKRIVNLYLPLFITALCLCFLYFFSTVFLFKSQETRPVETQNKLFNSKVLDDLFVDENSQGSLNLSTSFSSFCFLQAKHLRPNEKRLGRYLMMNQEVRFIPFSKPFYCKTQVDKLAFSDEVQKLKACIELKNEQVWANIYCHDANTDTLIDRVMLKSQEPGALSKLNELALKVRDAKLYRQDCLFNKYGGSIFQMRKSRLRFSIGKNLFFIRPSQVLVYKNDAFEISSDQQNKIVLSVQAHARGAKFLLFSENGHECIEIEKSFEPVKPFFNALMLKDLQIFNGEMIKCRIFDKRVTLEKGDWVFIHNTKKILPLRNFDQIQKCINSLLPGSLVIIDEIQKTNNNEFVILGHFFDETRQSMSEIRQIVKVKI